MGENTSTQIRYQTTPSNPAVATRLQAPFMISKMSCMPNKKKKLRRITALSMPSNGDKR
jgi:hypothetical protein